MPKFSIAKSIKIDAPIDKVFTAVRDFKKWHGWSPWLIAEPDCKVTYSDDGKSYDWDGKIVGAGGTEIVGESSPKSIDYKLTFLRPFKSKADVRFSFSEREGGTEATWSMDSSLPFFLFWMKRMMVIFIGMDYERGLNMLKDDIETGSVPSKLAFAAGQVFGGCSYVGIRTTCPIPEIGPAMERDMSKLKSALGDGSITPAGKPFSAYHSWKLGKGTVEYTIAVPVEGSASAPAGFVTGELPACSAYTVTHTGPYRHIGNAWSAAIMHARSKVFRKNNKAVPFEVYENSPEDTAETELVTVVHFPEKA